MLGKSTKPCRQHGCEGTQVIRSRFQPPRCSRARFCCGWYQPHGLRPSIPSPGPETPREAQEDHLKVPRTPPTAPGCLQPRGLRRGEQIQRESTARGTSPTPGAAFPCQTPPPKPCSGEKSQEHAFSGGNSGWKASPLASSPAPLAGSACCSPTCCPCSASYQA